MECITDNESNSTNVHIPVSLTAYFELENIMHACFDPKYAQKTFYVTTDFCSGQNTFQKHPFSPQEVLFTSCLISVFLNKVYLDGELGHLS